MVKVSESVKEVLFEAYIHVRDKQPQGIIKDYPFNPDNAVCHPIHRWTYLDEVSRRLFAKGIRLDECTILRSLMNLRKQGALPKSSETVDE